MFQNLTILHYSVLLFDVVLTFFDVVLSFFDVVIPLLDDVKLRDQFGKTCSILR